jgi:enamine deaminase RidA (YjgF/YER057c/UK114 family)
MAQTHTFLHPSGWKPAKGFSNGVVAQGRMVFLAGQVGWNAEQKFESGDFVAQARRRSPISSPWSAKLADAPTISPG